MPFRIIAPRRLRQTRLYSFLAASLLALGPIEAQQFDNEEVLFFDGRAGQTASANGGAVIFPLESRSWRWWFQNVLGARVAPNGVEVAYWFNGILHLADLNGQNARAIEFPDTPASPLVSWSPSGERLAYYSQYPEAEPFNPESYLNIVDRNGNLLARHIISARKSTPPSWSPDGTRIAYAEPLVSSHNKLSCIEVASGIVTPLFAPPYISNEAGYRRSNIQFPVWLPDGRVAFYWQENDGQYRAGMPSLITVTTGIATVPGCGGDASWVQEWQYQYDSGFPGVPPGRPGLIFSLAASPDGSRFVFDIAAGFLQQGMYIVDSDGGAPSWITSFSPRQGGFSRVSLQWVILNPNILEVNDTGDDPDADPGDGVIDTNLAAPGLQITLRAAIDAANAVAGSDTITFDIESAGVPEIIPDAPLPAIAEGVTIDGTTQPGSGCVRISGSGTTPVGLAVDASDVKLRGLMVTNCTTAGIDLRSGSGHLVEECLIGTDGAGTPGLGNGIGIKIRNTANSMLGGITEASRNVISGNATGVDAAASAGLTIASNFIGVAPDGSTPMAGTTTGVLAENCSNLKVGAQEMVSVINAQVGVAARNVAPSGQDVVGATLENVNFNLDESGTTQLGTMMQTAVCVENSDKVTIGGTTEDTVNAVAGATLNAYEVINSTAVNVKGNRIGTDRAGMVAMAVQGAGILVEGGEDNELGTQEEVLVVNAQTGVLARNIDPSESAAVGVAMQNMHMNLDRQGTQQLGTELATGVRLELVRRATIGKDTMTKVHISASTGNAIEMADSSEVGVGPHLLGTTRDGTGSLPVQGTGILVERCEEVTIGVQEQVSVVNAAVGVVISDCTPSAPDKVAAAIQNVNFNLDEPGTTQLGTMMQTAVCVENSDKVTIGGTTEDTVNAVAGATLNAYEVINSTAVKVKGNRIGTDRAGMVAMAVQGAGILVEGGEDNELGTEEEVLVVNAQTGVLARNIDPSAGAAMGVAMQNMYMNLDRNGAQQLGTQLATGVRLELVQRATIGEETRTKILVAASTANAIEMVDSSEVGVGPHLLGTTRDGTGSLPIQGTGVLVERCEEVKIGAQEQVSVVNAAVGVMISDCTPSAPDKVAATLQNVNFNLDEPGTTQLGTMMQTAVCVENSEKVTIGGATENTANAVAGVAQNACDVINSTAVEVTGNRIGVARAAETAFAIAGDSVCIDGAASSVDVVGNAIQNATGAGVNVLSAGSNAVIRQNRIVNCGSAIQRAAHGASSAIAAAGRGSTHAEGTVSGAPGETLTIDFYAYNPSAPSPELDLFIGTTTVMLDPSGNGTYNEVFPATAPLGWALTNTVTSDAEGTTALTTPIVITPPLNTDGDDFPDAYEDQYPDIFDSAVPDDPDADSDMDGRSDGEEFELGTDPTDPGDSLFEALTNQASGFEVQIRATEGRRYTLERLIEGSTPTSWESLTSTYAPLSETLILTDTSPPPIRALYRVTSQVE